MTRVEPDKRLNYYRQSPEEVIAELKSHRLGLTNAEAERRLEQHGANLLYHGHHELPLLIFLRQFKSLFVVILLCSVVFSLYLHDGKTATILMLIALTNATVGFFQEYKAETLAESLEQLLVPHAKVLRNGDLKGIDSTKLVIGDIVYVEEGDSIPADLRILDEDELTTNDFALTGESNPTRKFVHALTVNVPLAVRHNLAFMGTTVATGTAHGIVIGTGMHTELGRIASLSQTAHTDPSPLQREMNHLATRITQGTLLLALLLAVIALRSNLGLKNALLFAIGISSAMIPTGLVAEVNITLAQTANRMAKAFALIKKLSAVETLGSTSIILTDKTGTLTKNEMTVADMLIGRTTYHASGNGYDPAGRVLNEESKPLTKKALNELSFFFTTAVLACNAKVSQPDAQHHNWYVLGDPTEGALITLARKAGLNTEALGQQYHEMKEYQFDSGRKMMSSVRQYNKQLIVFVKGAPEAVLAHSHTLWNHNHIRTLTNNDRSFFAGYNDAQAKGAMRNLALAYRILPAATDLKKFSMADIEEKLTLLGIVSMHDPLRDDVPAAMTAANEAHIRISIITGDYPATAKAIAVQAGLAATHEEVKLVLADELATLADAQVLQLLEDGGAIFSRVSPEDKLRIVEIAKTSNNIVAVTGDGINDAPALKRADIGVAMGRSGTDVAKDAAEIVLLDDDFTTLVGAVEQGRLTFQNIRKAARCVLTDNASELFLVLIGLATQALFHVPLAITAIQVLAVDLAAQMAPVTALGWDKPLANLMHDHPRKLSDHIVTWATVKEFILFGLLASGIAYANFLFFFSRHHLSPAYIDLNNNIYLQATVLTYVTVVFCQFINLLLVRADEHGTLFTSYLWSNKKLLAAFGLSLIFILNIVYNPLIQPYFHAGALSFTDWLTAVVGAAIYLSLRLLQRHTRNHTRHAVIKLHREIHGATSPAHL